MKEELRIQILLEVFKDTMAHLRSTDDKRDRLFNTYITLMLAVISGLLLVRRFSTGGSTNAYSARDYLLQLTLVLMLFLFGEVTYFALVGSRKWHAEYVNCAIILQKMISTNTQNVVSTLVPIHLRHPFTGNVFTNRQLILVQIGVFGTICLILSVFIDQVADTEFYILAASTSLAIPICNSIVAARILHKAEVRFWGNPRRCWVLAGLGFDKNKE